MDINFFNNQFLPRETKFLPPETHNRRTIIDQIWDQDGDQLITGVIRILDGDKKHYDKFFYHRINSNMALISQPNKEFVDAAIVGNISVGTLLTKAPLFAVVRGKDGKIFNRTISIKTLTEKYKVRLPYTRDGYEVKNVVEDSEKVNQIKFDAFKKSFQ